MSEPKNKVDNIFSQLKNNTVIAVLIVFGVIVIGLATFTDAAKKLLVLLDIDQRPQINGTWRADVSYDWKNANYSETFNFKGEGKEIYGTASFLGRKRSIVEGIVENNNLNFITETQEIIGSQPPKATIHHYRAVISGSNLEFIMTTKGGYSEHIPIEFTAHKVVDSEK